MDLQGVLLHVIGLFVGLLLTALLYLVSSLIRLHAKYDHLPGPKRSSFFLGNIDMVMACRDPMESMKPAPAHGTHLVNIQRKKLKPLFTDMFTRWHDDYGDTYVLYFLTRVWILTRSPNVLKTLLVSGDQSVFVKTLKLHTHNIFGARYMAEGLATTADYHGWYLRRRALDPAFHRNQLRNTIDIFNHTGDQFISKLQGYAESGETFRLSHLLHRSTIDVVMRSMFSMDPATLSSEFHEKAVAFVNDSFAALQSLQIPFMQWNPLKYWYRKKTRLQIEEFRSIGAKMIQERITVIQTEDDVPHDFLSILVQAYLNGAHGYTFDIMVDEFLTVVIAGMETTANLMAMTFMELGRQPHIVKNSSPHNVSFCNARLSLLFNRSTEQVVPQLLVECIYLPLRIVQEVDEVVGKKSFISNEDISRLSYISALIKESLRVYPPLFLITRETNADVEVDGLKIPADSMFAINIYGANRNPNLIDDANIFNPERFTANSQQRVPVYSNLSFSLGPRNCIGQNFAQMEMKVMLAKFFQHYTLHLADTEQYELGMRATLFPYSELQCTVCQRTD